VTWWFFWLFLSECWHEIYSKEATTNPILLLVVKEHGYHHQHSIQAWLWSVGKETLSFMMFLWINDSGGSLIAQLGSWALFASQSCISSPRWNFSVQGFTSLLPPAPG
jgi:hypothetical protein